MKIALVTENLDIERGGAEKAVFELAGKLTQAGCAVTLIGPEPHKQRAREYLQHTQQDYPFELTMLETASSSWLRWRSFNAQVAALLAERTFDVVHATTPISGADVFQPRGGSILHSMRRARRAETRPLLRWLRVPGDACNAGRQARITAERRLCRADDGPLILALSDYVAAQFRNLYGVPDERLRLLRNGVNVAALRSEEARRKGARLRPYWTRDGAETLLLFAAENFRLKGLAWLIRAVGVLAGQADQDRPPFRVLIAGSDDWTSYWRMVRRGGLERRFTFLGGTREMPALFHAADAVVLPTFNDACSRVVMEALAADKPVLTTAWNGAAEFMQDGRHGVILPRNHRHDGDPRALAAALATLLSPSRRRPMAEAITADALWRRVSVDRHIEELTEMYQQAARRHTGFSSPRR